MPRLLTDTEEGSTTRRRKNRTKKKRGRRHHRKLNTDCTAGIDRPTPNVQQIEPQQLLTENDVFVDLENLDGDNIAHYFMTKDDADPKLEDQSEPVVCFCHHAALSELQFDRSKISSEKVCLIDDRTCQGSTSKELGVREPLDAYEMLGKLRRKVSGI
ncbi:hypothetical protein FPOA_05082 [Fusarium poae]|uniref:Uncharacterized protein n=1 Tax=Fusarium poae TaxID=36050 RepID=A0A1B8AVZ9_FUSPO|nr:hypothetical protein FPOA_05082 [Fusarium poae]